jgi:hypothetical protein
LARLNAECFFERSLINLQFYSEVALTKIEIGRGERFELSGDNQIESDWECHVCGYNLAATMQPLDYLPPFLPEMGHTLIQACYCFSAVHLAQLS